MDFFNKGTYYLTVRTSHENYQTAYEGNINITAAAIPVSKVFAVQQKVSKNKNYVTVTIPNTLQEYVKSVQYCKGSVGIASVNDKKIWKYSLAGDFYGGRQDTKVLTSSGSTYTFKAVKNGTYTILIDGNGRYSKTIKVTGIDNVKPKVTGVKNKKTYKKTVKIKFSDKGSGIKSAKLNGKKIKSGKKVSKAGKYKLVVIDKAGNKTTITFTMKKTKK